MRDLKLKELTLKYGFEVTQDMLDNFANYRKDFISDDSLKIIEEAYARIDKAWEYCDNFMYGVKEELEEEYRFELALIEIYYKIFDMYFQKEKIKERSANEE